MSQINLENREVDNERLEIGAGVVYFLGPNLTLRGCTLNLKIAARNLVIPQVRLIDCVIEARRHLKNFRWAHAHLKGCRFRGQFTGNDFGNWPSSPGEGSIENCDFSEAQLDGCRFMDCDTGTLRFPAWPCFTILEPYKRHRELAVLPWPGEIGPIEVEGFAEDPPTTVAVTYFAPDLAGRCGTTPEAIRSVLETLDGVRY